MLFAPGASMLCKTKRCPPLMSNTQESEFDLEKLFLPAWATDTPSVNKYANFTGEEGPRRRDDGPRDNAGEGAPQ